MLSEDIYTTIMEFNEWWFVYSDGSAMLITDQPPMDC